MRFGIWLPSPEGWACDAGGAVCDGVDAGAPPDGNRTGIIRAGLIAPDKAEREGTDSMAVIML
jgi:hypothetical protein